MSWEIILGPPGTGKTETLIRIVEELLADGTLPQRIAYLAFTRRAAHEARDRAQAKFAFTDAEMPWYKTIHSLAFKQIGARSTAVMVQADYRTMANQAGYSFAGKFAEGEEDLYEMEEADGLIFLENLARIRMTTIEELWPVLGDRIHAQYELDHVTDLRMHLNTYKGSTGKIDFTDFLTKFMSVGVVPPVDVVIVDEAQDLSRLQWEVVNKVTSKSKRVIIAGDSDQAIYRWAGADVEHFQGLASAEEANQVRILDQSYRVPKSIWSVSQKIIKRIKNRMEQPYLPKADTGKVQLIYEDSELDASTGTWLFLCRHTHQLRSLKATCFNRGWFFECKDKASNRTDAALAIMTWENLRRGKAVRVREALSALWFAAEDDAEAKLKGEYPHVEEFVTASTITAIAGISFKDPWSTSDGAQRLSRIDATEAEYFIQARRAGEAMAVKDEDGILRPAPPRIRISTIHGSKGAQAQGVYLLIDLSESSFQSLEIEDDEHRTFYVAVTRAEKQLVIQHPLEARYYEIPELDDDISIQD
jgi:DNA helicase-2/ATP-dependent DNA helicase PcrA